MAKCLVLGANGFIGSHLVDALADRGHEVRAFIRPGYEKVKFRESDRVDIFNGDYLNRDDVGRAVTGMDYVFHFISTTTPATAENDPLIDIETNIKSSVVLFEECVKHKVKKVIFASTGGAIYGGTTGKPIPETAVPSPVSPYAIGKLAIEHYLDYFVVKYGLNSLRFRISNPYGSRHPLHSKQGVINIFLEKIARNEPITIMGDGTMVRDYIYVTDVVKMIADNFENTQQRLYNLGSGKGVSINDVVKVIEKVVGKSVAKESRPIPTTFVNKIVLDTTRFKDEFNSEPTITLDEGIKKTWEYVKKMEDEIRAKI